jgi:SAM-dependent methyltransferase
MKVATRRDWLRRQLRQIPAVVEARLVLRGLAHVGRRYTCNCCGWRLRAFVERNQFFGACHDGYCPRCDAKARHRGLWLFLTNNGLLTDSSVRLLDIGPWPKIAALLSGLDNVSYVGLDIRRLPHVTLVADITSLGVEDAAFDALVCVHVLEHVMEDGAAIREFHRVLKPGAWAIISVPLRLDRPTFEDPTITDREDRKRFFGEATHVRYYGTDLLQRLEAAGFEVRLHRADDVAESLRRLHGLRDNEHIVFCTRRVPPFNS